MVMHRSSMQRLPANQGFSACPVSVAVHRRCAKAALWARFRQTPGNTRQVWHAPEAVQNGDAKAPATPPRDRTEDELDGVHYLFRDPGDSWPSRPFNPAKKIWWFITSFLHTYVAFVATVFLYIIIKLAAHD